MTTDPLANVERLLLGERDALGWVAGPNLTEREREAVRLLLNVAREEVISDRVGIVGVRSVLLAFARSLGETT